MKIISARHRILSLFTLSLFFLLGCAAEEELTNSTSTLIEEVVRGAPDRGRTPSVVAVLDARGGLCSGTLIAPRAVLTARHCVSELQSPRVRCDDGSDEVLENFPPDRFSIVVGETIETGVIAAKGTRVLVPPTEFLCGADLAVLLLNQSITTITPSPVAIDGGLYVNDEVSVVGFGRRGTRGSSGQKERRDAVPLLQVSTREVIVGPAVCPGDSGGPALLNGTVVAVLSRGGASCSASSSMNVYTRTSAWSAFLREAILAGGGSVQRFVRETHDEEPTHEASDWNEPCARSEECTSGLCLRSTNRCTRECGTGLRCPRGFRCENVSGGVRVCAPSW